MRVLSAFIWESRFGNEPIGDWGERGKARLIASMGEQTAGMGAELDAFADAVASPRVDLSERGVGRRTELARRGAQRDTKYIKRRNILQKINPEERPIGAARTFWTTSIAI